MNERIKQIQVALGMSQKDFAEAIGIAPGALSNIYSNRTNATNNHVNGIHKAFPQINVSWLMFGEGQMYLPSPSVSTDEVEAVEGSYVVADDNLGMAGMDQPGVSGANSGANGYGNAQANGLGRMTGAQTVYGVGGKAGSQVARAGGYEGTLFDEPASGHADLLPFQNARTAQPSKRGARVDQSVVDQVQIQAAKNIDVVRRQVKEIRVFFDDGTYETFVPGK